MLYAADIDFDVPGDWTLEATVKSGADSVRLSCGFPVSLSSGKATGLWPYLSLPPLAVALFALNQWLRRDWVQKV
jgi:hypothetical protein